ncbi:MAG: response regulator transcription factor [bacterium]|nr:response regulator transcription factor [bacterium]
MVTYPSSAHARPLILVVDDERRVREVMRNYLERADFRVADAESGRQALALIRQTPPDLIVLDVMLPEIDGFAMTQILRDPHDPAHPLVERTHIPIILLTARRDEIDRVWGLELGADDYVVKPFSPRELVARVKAVLRRTASASATAAPLSFADFQINPLSRTLTQRGQSIALTKIDFDLLFFLVSHPNQVFTHEQILAAIWANASDVDRSVVTSHIYRLREKIEADPEHPVFLQTVWGVGYKFEMD